MKFCKENYTDNIVPPPPPPPPPHTHTSPTLTYRYPVETSYTIIKVLAKVAGLSTLAKDQPSEFFSSPHSCSFTKTQDHHGNQPVVADSIAKFHEAVREGVVASGLSWSGSGKQHTSSELSGAMLVSHSEVVKWSYVALVCSELPAQVCEI